MATPAAPAFLSDEDLALAARVAEARADSRPPLPLEVGFAQLRARIEAKIRARRGL